ncbi:MAG TPA: polysaccharide biosynthesis/export family protein [Bacteroidia bacterium]
MSNKHILYLLVLLLFAGSCKTYTGNIILKTEKEDENWKDAYSKVIIEYPIKVGDKIQFTLFTNEGESIIDPTGNLIRANTQNANGGSNEPVAQNPIYEVLETGECLFPVIGKLQVVGLKTSQLDSILSVKFEAYYNGVYVLSKVVNKKVTVLGGNKGGAIVPFSSNMNLLEVLAIYGGLSNDNKGYNIRIIRGDLKDPQVKIVNLRTIADMKASIVTLMPDDIIYIEPIRKPAAEGIRDNIYILNIVQVLVTLTVLFSTIK